MSRSAKTPLTPTLSRGGEGACLRLDGAVGWHGVDPPPSRRVEFNGSGAPSGMTAQPQLVQGCTICGVPSDPESEVRESAEGGRLGGVAFLLVTFLWPRKEKSLAQARRAGETPSRAGPSHPAWQSHAISTNPRTSDYASLIRPTEEPTADAR